MGGWKRQQGLLKSGSSPGCFLEGCEVGGAEAGGLGFEGLIGRIPLLDGGDEVGAVRVAKAVGHEAADTAAGIPAAGEESEAFELVGAVPDHLPGKRLAVGRKRGAARLEPCLAVKSAGTGLERFPPAESELELVNSRAENGGQQTKFPP